MVEEFEVVSCHGDHAGKAHLSVRRGACGAQIAIQHMPFEADAGESLAEEQSRILCQAAKIAREAADFFEAEAGQMRGWPDRKQAAEPNAFGQPIPRG